MRQSSAEHSCVIYQQGPVMSSEEHTVWWPQQMLRDTLWVGSIGWAHWRTVDVCSAGSCVPICIASDICHVAAHCLPSLHSSTSLMQSALEQTIGLQVMWSWIVRFFQWAPRMWLVNVLVLCYVVSCDFLIILWQIPFCCVVINVYLTQHTCKYIDPTQGWGLPPRRTPHTKLPACNSAYHPTTKNRQWLSASNQEQFIRITNANKRQWTTSQACTQHNHHPTGHTILHRWITRHRPLLGLQSDTATSTVHLHHAHAAHSTASTHHMGLPHQSESQVQPTHAPVTTDNKATLFSNSTITANWDTAQL
jgi:hypothetical protein